MALLTVSLCSGIGGLDLGFRAAVPGARTVCYVEREAYAVAVLVSRMASGELDDAPVWSDLRSFDCGPWRGRVGCVLAALPCQPFSRAGRRQTDGHPHWLWDDCLRVVYDLRPALFFMENVDALRVHGGRRMAVNLASLGYVVAWDLFSARAVGAPHTRPRLFLLAAKRDGLDDTLCGRHWAAQGQVRPGGQAAFPPSPRVLHDDAGLRARWPEPGVPRGADGAADRLDRLRVAGNAVVPAVATGACLSLRDVILKTLRIA